MNEEVIMSEEVIVYKIEKKIPIPPKVQIYCHWKKLILGMSAGDSVVLPIKYQNAIIISAKRLCIHMTTRKLTETTIRAWRMT